MRKIKLNSALITNEENERNRESSLLSMQFKIRRHHVKNARIEIRCEAKIFNMFSRTRDKEIFVKTHSAENQHQPQNNFHSSQPSSTIIFEFGKFKIIILLTFFSFICAWNLKVYYVIMKFAYYPKSISIFVAYICLEISVKCLFPKNVSENS